MKYFFMIMGIILSSSVNATHVDCGYTSVGLLYVIGARSDGTANADRLQVAIPSECVAGKALGFVSNDDASYQGILSMLLAAKMSNKRIRIVVDDSVTTHNSVRIEWVNFE